MRAHLSPRKSSLGLSLFAISVASLAGRFSVAALKPMRGIFFLALLALLPLPLDAAGLRSTDLDSDAPELLIGGASLLLSDPTGAWSVADVLAPERAADPPRGEPLSGKAVPGTNQSARLSPS